MLFFHVVYVYCYLTHSFVTFYYFFSVFHPLFSFLLLDITSLLSHGTFFFFFSLSSFTIIHNLSFYFTFKSFNFFCFLFIFLFFFIRFISIYILSPLSISLSSTIPFLFSIVNIFSIIYPCSSFSLPNSPSVFSLCTVLF